MKPGLKKYLDLGLCTFRDKFRREFRVTSKTMRDPKLEPCAKAALYFLSFFPFRWRPDSGALSKRISVRSRWIIYTYPGAAQRRLSTRRSPARSHSHGLVCRPSPLSLQTDLYTRCGV